MVCAAAGGANASTAAKAAAANAVGNRVMASLPAGRVGRIYVSVGICRPILDMDDRRAGAARQTQSLIHDQSQRANAAASGISRLFRTIDLGLTPVLHRRNAGLLDTETTMKTTWGVAAAFCAIV